MKYQVNLSLNSLVAARIAIRENIILAWRSRRDAAKSCGIKFAISCYDARIRENITALRELQEYTCQF